MSAQHTSRMRPSAAPLPLPGARAGRSGQGVPFRRPAAGGANLAVRVRGVRVVPPGRQRARPLTHGLCSRVGQGLNDEAADLFETVHAPAPADATLNAAGAQDGDRGATSQLQGSPARSLKGKIPLAAATVAAQQRERLPVAGSSGNRSLDAEVGGEAHYAFDEFLARTAKQIEKQLQADFQRQKNTAHRVKIEPIVEEGRFEEFARRVSKSPFRPLLTWHGTTLESAASIPPPLSFFFGAAHPALAIDPYLVALLGTTAHRYRAMRRRRIFVHRLRRPRSRNTATSSRATWTRRRGSTSR